MSASTFRCVAVNACQSIGGAASQLITACRRPPTSTPASEIHWPAAISRHIRATSCGSISRPPTGRRGRAGTPPAARCSDPGVENALSSGIVARHHRALMPSLRMAAAICLATVYVEVCRWRAMTPFEWPAWAHRATSSSARVSAVRRPKEKLTKTTRGCVSSALMYKSAGRSGRVRVRSVVGLGVRSHAGCNSVIACIALPPSHKLEQGVLPALAKHPPSPIRTGPPERRSIVICLGGNGSLVAAAAQGGGFVSVARRECFKGHPPASVFSRHHPLSPGRPVRPNVPT